MSSAYKDAGVDIDAGNKLVEAIKPVAKTTSRKEVMADIGGFGALVGIPAGYRQPILVSGTDGVGTKLKLAQQLNNHRTIGIDLVAMCVNDIVVSGAEPLFFLDYYATGKLNLTTSIQIIEGIGEGCRQAGAALVGGETAEMPVLYDHDEYDLAGFAVGIVEKEEIITGKSITAGDILIGLASSGVHSNGFSLVHKIIADHKVSLNTSFGNTTLGETLLTPTYIYVPTILKLLKKVKIKGLCHITGGGLVENVPRILPAGCAAHINQTSWQLPPIFKWLHQIGNVDYHEMFRVFNCGIGMVIIADKKYADEIKAICNTTPHTPYLIGSIATSAKHPEVVFV